MSIWEITQLLAQFVFRFALALVFLTSSVGKVRNRYAFVTVAVNYQLLPKQWARRFALVLPWVELGVGLVLLLGVATQPAAIAAILLLLSFMVAVGVNLLRGRKYLDCGCAGAHHRQKISGWLLLRNTGLIVLAAALMLWGRDNPVVTHWLAQVAAFSLRSTVFVDGGLPFVLVVCGILMLVLLFQQIRRFTRMEAKS